MMFDEEVFKLLRLEQAIMDSIIDLVTYDKIIDTACCCFECSLISIESGCFMLIFSHCLGTEVASVIEALTPFEEIEVVAIYRLYIPNERVLTNLPILDELEIGYLPLCAE